MTRIVMNIPQMTDAARFMRAVSVEYENLGRQLQSGALLGEIPSNVRYWVDTACRGIGSRLSTLSTDLTAEARLMDWRTGIVTQNPVIRTSYMLSLPGTSSVVSASSRSWFAADAPAGRNVLVIGGQPSASWSAGMGSSGIYLDPAAVAAANRSSRIVTLGPGSAYVGGSITLDPAAVAAANRSSRIVTLGPGTAYTGSPIWLDSGGGSSSSIVLAPPSNSGPKFVLDVEGGLAENRRYFEMLRAVFASGGLPESVWPQFVVDAKRFTQGFNNAVLGSDRDGDRVPDMFDQRPDDNYWY